MAVAHKTVAASLTVALVLIVAAGVAYRHFAIVQPLKHKVLEALSDPDSAQFRNLKLYSDWSQKRSVLCGEVNAKNRMGGYVGFRYFEAGGFADEAAIDSAETAAAFAATSRQINRCDYSAVVPWWGVPF